jgi:hypothetical protein
MFEIQNGPRRRWNDVHRLQYRFARKISIEATSAGAGKIGKVTLID